MTVRKLGIIGVLLVCSTGLVGQSCGWSGRLPVPAVSVDTFLLNITDYLVDDLSAQEQGLCKVSLQFSHDWAKDLNVFLIAPGGQQIQLIGGASSAGSSLLATWDIDFVRCSEMAKPDADFPAQWDHAGNDYLIGGQYRGSYYPFSGCLEDFSTGPVNGIWKIVIQNGNASGILNGVRLQFCNSNGVNCCLANGGQLPDLFVRSACEGDSSLTLIDLEPLYTFPEIIPDSDLYSYVFLIADQDRILATMPVVDLITLPPGPYSVFGLSYLRADSTALFEELENGQISSLNTLLAGSDPPWCAELTLNPALVEILPVPPVTQSQFQICAGDSVVVEGTVLKEAGLYEWMYTATNGCDSLVQIQLEVLTPEFDIVVSDTLSCDTERVSLKPDSLALSGDYLFEWEGPAGIFPSPNTPEIVTGAAGLYQLEVTEVGSGCKATNTVVVEIDSLAPVVSILPFQGLTCDSDSVILQGEGEAFSGTALWQWGQAGQLFAGFDSTEVLIRDPGNYWLRLEDSENGCADTAWANVPLSGRPIQDVFWKVSAEQCEPTSSLQVDILRVEGGTPPYQYWLDGLPATAAGWSDLNAGTVALLAEDVDGCQFSTELELNRPAELDVDLGPDFTIAPGFELVLAGRVEGQWDSLSWSPSSLLPTSDPLQKLFVGDSTQVIYLEAFDALGCSAADSVTIFVSSPSRVYVPNAFSPNADGNNDIFFLQASDEVRLIRYMAVFDRWGNQIFQVRNVPPNNSTYGWDGRWRGASVAPGVYLYLIDVEYQGGTVGQFHGGVHVVGMDR